MLNHVDIQERISEIVSRPLEHLAKEEAAALLRRYGILDQDNEITSTYDDIFERKFI